MSGGDRLGDRLEETVVVSATSGAARAMRRSAAARFRECRFRVLETFERDAAKVARFLEKNSLSTRENEKNTEAAETRARATPPPPPEGRKEGSASGRMTHTAPGETALRAHTRHRLNPRPSKVEGRVGTARARAACWRRGWPSTSTPRLFVRSPCPRARRRSGWRSRPGSPSGRWETGSSTRARVSGNRR